MDEGLNLDVQKDTMRMKNIYFSMAFIMCVLIFETSYGADRIFFENCEDVNFSEHFLERHYGSDTESYWNEFKSDIARSSDSPHSGNYCMTYDPWVTGNPHSVVGYAGQYGNSSRFNLSDINSRYWYFKWYQRWQTGINWSGSIENKLLYVNYNGDGDFTLTIQRNGPNNFHITSKDRDTRDLTLNLWLSHSGGSLDDMEWHKMEVYLDVGTTGNSNGQLRVWVDDIELVNRTNIRWNGTIHSNPIAYLTGWPSNTSGTASGNGRTWLDDLEIWDGMPDGTSSVDNNPSVIISTPTAGTTYETNIDTLSFQGTASDDNGLASISWSYGNDQQGTISSDLQNWSTGAITLQEGTNQFIVTATDNGGNTASDTLNVTYNPDGVGTGTVRQQLWDASTQTGDQSWSDSSAIWCVRALVEGSSISQAGDAIRLGFMGRSSSDYQIKKVSIAEVDAAGGQGAAIDSTWTPIIFDDNSRNTWSTDVTTIPAGTEKLSKAVNFSIDPSKDYYVTFMLESASAYLVAPSDYQQLYFSGADHASEIDWTNNGFSTYNARLHAISSIYVGLKAPTGLTIVEN